MKILMGIFHARLYRRANFFAFFRIAIPKRLLPVRTSEGLFALKKFFSDFAENRVSFGNLISNKRRLNQNE